MQNIGMQPCCACARGGENKNICGRIGEKNPDTVNIHLNKEREGGGGDERNHEKIGNSQAEQRYFAI